MGTADKRLNAAFLKAYRSSALTAQGGFCRYCLAPLLRTEATADHRVARARGGGDHQRNIAAACAECNRAKSAMSEAAFMSAVKGNGAVPLHLRMARFRRRMWLAVHRSSERIMAAAGGSYQGPRRAA